MSSLSSNSEQSNPVEAPRKHLSDKPVDLYLIGTGLSLSDHLTPQAKNVIQNCSKLFHVTAFHQELSDLCTDITNWNELYLASDSTDVYQIMADNLLDEATKQPGIGFAVYGHPLVWVTTSRMLIESGAKRGLRVEVIPGISSIDILLKYLNLETSLAGLQVLEANQLVLNNIHPNRYVATLIMQIGAFGASTLTKARANHANRFDMLRDFLLEDYSPNHPVVLITCPFLENMELIQYQVPLGQLSSMHDMIHTGMSMYIPPLQPQHRNTTFLRKLQDETGVFRESRS